MAKQSPRQKEIVGRVMHEYKHGELERSQDGKGGKVRNPRQAIAIALSEAGASTQQSPQENRRRLSQTKAKESRGETPRSRKEGRGSGGSPKQAPTRQELYRQAQEANIAGRSHMSKDELRHALSRAHG
jgi:hypothetical protein